MKERWRPVVNFEKFYSVSDWGRVWSMRTEKMLRICLNTGGYPFICLHINGKQTQKVIGRLVLEAFVGPRPSKNIMRHGPKGKLNNTLKNLSWGTQKQNMSIDCARDGTLPLGERHGRSKLTWSEVQKIRKRVANGETQHDVAKDYPIQQAQISDIISHRAWKEEPPK